MRAFAAKRLCLCLLPALTAWPQTDPGMRGGPPGAGEPLRGLTRSELKFFNAGLDDFKEPQTVDGSQDGTGPGLGPRFNLDSCGGCHMHPAVGGSSPPRNPQAAFKTSGANNPALLPFVTEDGPVLEARFKSDGAVHALFVISGRADAPGCNIVQPDFPQALRDNNLSFRIPGAIFGAGLVEAIPESAILANKAANPAAKAALGISGRENRSSDGMLMRFGWKAQHHSLMAFSGEAYNVEQGVTNELSPQERDETPGCLFNSDPGRSHQLRPRAGPRVSRPPPAPPGPGRRLARSLQRRSQVRALHALSGPARAGRRGRLGHPGPGAVPARLPGLRPVPYAIVPHGPVLQRRPRQPDGEPVLRPAAPSHGQHSRRRHHPGSRRTGFLPHRAALGPRPAHLLSPRRPDQRPAGSHPAARRRRAPRPMLPSPRSAG